MINNEINNNEETLFTKMMNYNHQKELDRLSLLKKDEIKETDLKTETSLIDDHELSRSNNPSIKLNFFKECKMVLNNIIDRIEFEEKTQITSSFARFKKEMVNTLSNYIETARIDFNDAKEQSDQRNECISSLIDRRINLFKNLVHDYEEIEIDILEYLGY